MTEKGLTKVNSQNSHRFGKWLAKTNTSVSKGWEGKRMWCSGKIFKGENSQKMKGVNRENSGIAIKKREGDKGREIGPIDWGQVRGLNVVLSK